MARRKRTRDTYTASDSSFENIYDSPACRLVEAYVDRCGIVEDDFLFQQYQALYDAAVSREAFDELLQRVSWDPGEFQMPGRWAHGGVSYMVSGGISDQGYLYSLWLNAKHGLYSSDDERERAMDEVGENKAEHLRYIESERVKILDDMLARGLPPKVLDRSQIEKQRIDLVLEIEEVQALRSYVLSLRRLSRSDRPLVEYNLDFELGKIAYWVGDIGPIDRGACTEFARCCLTFGHVREALVRELEETEALMWEAARAMPIWRLNGHSVKEVLGEAPCDGREPWIETLARTREELGGADLEAPAREPARDFALEE